MSLNVYGTIRWSMSPDHPEIQSTKVPVSWDCPSFVVRGDANGKLTYLKCKPMFNYCGLQFQTSSISCQITPGNFLLGMLTKLFIQPVEPLVQGLDFDESLIIGIIGHKLNK